MKRPMRLRVSATTGGGVRELIETIGHWLVRNASGGDGDPVHAPSLADQVEEAFRACAAGEIRTGSGLLRAIGTR